MYVMFINNFVTYVQTHAYIYIHTYDMICVYIYISHNIFIEHSFIIHFYFRYIYSDDAVDDPARSCPARSLRLWSCSVVWMLR